MTKARILIVEDDRIVAEDIKISLEKLGFGVLNIVSSGEEALEIIDKDSPDLVLMDIMLKGEIDGTETAGKIRSMYNIPVVYVTAYADENVLTKAKHTEPFGYIVKPFEDIEINSAIELALYKHKMETRLKESEQWLSTTLNSIGDAVIATDEKSVVKFMNPVARTITGWKSEDAIGRPLNEIFNIINEQTREKVENPVTKVIRENKTVGLANHTLLISKNGNETPIDDSGAPIRDKDENIIGVVLVFRDISDYKQAEKERGQLQKQLQQSQKMESIGTLAGGIAHDFNNILGIILGNIELAISKIPESHPVQENLEAMKIASLRATDVIQQLLSFSRKTEQSRQPVRIGDITNECIRFLRSSIPTTIEIKTYLPDKPIVVMAVPTQIHQVLINLCNNSAHAVGEDGGVISIHLDNISLDGAKAKSMDLNPGPYAKISVGDTGKGISKDNMNKIFDPYFTTKEIGKGSGIGLSVVHGIIKNHDGKVLVESEKGIGTKFDIYLPLAETELKMKAKKRKPNTPKGTERILFVDDEPLIADISCQILEQLGYKVTPQTSSPQALEMLKVQPEYFDLVITDMSMPKLTGDKLAMEILKIRKDLPVIICTGFNERIDNEYVKSIGAKALIMKPITKVKLAETVRMALDGEMI